MSYLHRWRTLLWCIVRGRQGCCSLGYASMLSKYCQSVNELWLRILSCRLCGALNLLWCMKQHVKSQTVLLIQPKKARSDSSWIAPPRYRWDILRFMRHKIISEALVDARYMVMSTILHLLKASTVTTTLDLLGEEALTEHCKDCAHRIYLRPLRLWVQV